VSEVSGRGVGMDIVRKALHDLEGSVQVSTMEGIGTTFVLEVPVTLAVTDLLKVKAGGREYGIAMRDVRETLLIDSSHFEWMDGRYFYRVAGNELVHVWDLETMQL